MPDKNERNRAKIETFALDHNGGALQCLRHPPISEMTSTETLAALKAHTRVVVPRSTLMSWLDAIRPAIKRRSVRGPRQMDRSERDEGAKSRQRERYHDMDHVEYTAYRERKNRERRDARAAKK